MLVAAGNDTSFLGIAAALSFSGSVSVTPGVVVLVINNTTMASIDDGASVAALGDVAVEAHSSGDVLTIAAAGAVCGEAAVGGAVAYVVGQRHDAGQHRRHRDQQMPAGARGQRRGQRAGRRTDDTVAYLITGAFASGVGGGLGGAVSIVDLTKTHRRLHRQLRHGQRPGQHRWALGHPRRELRQLRRLRDDR